MDGERIIVSTAYLPPLGYMAELLRAAGIRIETAETYPKQTCRNRACIYGPNGLQVLSIPVRKPSGNHTRTADIRIQGDSAWQRSHWRSIETAYSNSPYFLHYRDYLSPFYSRRYDYLLDFNTSLLEIILRLMHVSREISFTLSYDLKPEGLTDHRNGLCAKHAKAVSPVYTQTFAERHGFLPNLSIIDLIFNTGPEAADILASTRAGA